MPIIFTTLRADFQSYLTSQIWNALLLSLNENLLDQSYSWKLLPRNKIDWNAIEMEKELEPKKRKEKEISMECRIIGRTIENTEPCTEDILQTKAGESACLPPLLSTVQCNCNKTYL